MTDEIYETPSTTPNFQTELAAQLADLIPEAIADGKVDVEKLKELLDGDAADGSERFGLFWPGKKRALRAAQEPTTATLKPDFENSKDWDTTKNVFIEGDNLEVLKILQKHYHAKIKMIYIDPPYNTGTDFVYPDNYREGLATYLEWTRQVNEGGKKVSTNPETAGRFHSNWLNMMYPRIKLARNLLKSDGVLCVSIDDREVENLKRLLAEVFGEDNFLAQLIWDKQHSQQQGVFKRYHEYVLVFARNAASLGGISGGDGFIDAGALKKVSRANPASKFTFPAGTRFDAPDGTELSGTFGDAEKVTVAEGRFVARGGVTAEPMTLIAGWTQKNQMASWFAGSETVDSKGQRVVEFYFNSTGKLKCRKERGVITPPSLLPRYGMASEQTAALDLLMGGHFFNNPKPVGLIKDLARWFTSESDIVLDFFAGSGTSAQSVLELNAEDDAARRFIVVQIPEPLPASSPGRELGWTNIAQVCRQRVDFAGEQVGGGLDAGFRYFRLVDTNFSKWRLSSDVEEEALEQYLLSIRDSAADGATADELLTEILLKQGYSLTEVISMGEVSGLDVRVVRDADGDVAVLAYLNEHVKPTLEQLRDLVALAPQRLLVLEDAFHGDDELKTNLVQMVKSQGSGKDSDTQIWTA